MMQLIQEAQQFLEVQFVGQALRYFRMCKEIEAKMGKQTEK